MWSFWRVLNFSWVTFFPIRGEEEDSPNVTNQYWAIGRQQQVIYKPSCVSSYHMIWSPQRRRERARLWGWWLVSVSCPACLSSDHQRFDVWRLNTSKYPPKANPLQNPNKAKKASLSKSSSFNSLLALYCFVGMDGYVSLCIYYVLRTYVGKGFRLVGVGKMSVRFATPMDDMKLTGVEYVKPWCYENGLYLY